MISADISAHIEDVTNYRFFPYQVLKRIEWVEGMNMYLKKSAEAMSKSPTDMMKIYVGWKKTSQNDFVLQFARTDGKYRFPGGSEGSLDVNFEHEKETYPKLVLRFPAPPGSQSLGTIVYDFSPVTNLEEALRFPSEALETFKKVVGFRE